MSIKFNDTQLVLLSAASQRDDHCLVPPAGPRRGQVQKATAKLVEAGLLKEIKAKAGAPCDPGQAEEECGAINCILTSVAHQASSSVTMSPVTSTFRADDRN
jgi:hypothetical protein